MFEKTHRWTAEIFYSHRASRIFEMEELEELQTIVEYGPDFNLIEKIVITYNLGEKK